MLERATVVTVNPDGTADLLINGVLVPSVPMGGVGHTPLASVAVRSRLLSQPRGTLRPSAPKKRYVGPRRLSVDIAPEDFDNFEITRVDVDGLPDGSAYLGSVVEIFGAGLDKTQRLWFPVENFEENFAGESPPTYTTKEVTEDGETYRLADLTDYIQSIEEDKIVLVLPDIGVGDYGVCGILSGHVHADSNEDEEAISPDGVQVHTIYDLRPRLYITPGTLQGTLNSAFSEEAMDLHVQFYNAHDTIVIPVVNTGTGKGPIVTITADSEITRPTPTSCEVFTTFSGSVLYPDGDTVNFGPGEEIIVNLDRVTADYSMKAVWTRIRDLPVPPDDGTPFVVFTSDFKIEKSDATTITDTSQPPDTQRELLLNYTAESMGKYTPTKMLASASTTIQAGKLAISCDDEPEKQEPRPVGSVPSPTVPMRYLRIVSRAPDACHGTFFDLNGEPWVVQMWSAIWPPSIFAPPHLVAQLDAENDGDRLFQGAIISGYGGEIVDDNFVSYHDFYGAYAAPVGSTITVSRGFARRPEPVNELDDGFGVGSQPFDLTYMVYIAELVRFEDEEGNVFYEEGAVLHNSYSSPGVVHGVINGGKQPCFSLTV